MRALAIAAVLMASPALAADPPPVGPKVDQPGKLPEPAPPSVPQVAYDSRLLSSYAAAESFQGPLDGGWTLSAGKQGDLYALQFTDKRDELSGAWRDLKRGRGPNASGVLDQVQRTPQGLLLRFTPPGATPVQVTVHGDLQGELIQGDRRTKVAMRKDPPLPQSSPVAAPVR